MRLTFEQIKAISTGAVRVIEGHDGIRLYRFTEEQEKLYEETDIEFYNRMKSTAGIKLAFKTNSKSLFLKTKIVPRYCRRYFSIDVFVDEKPIGYIDNFADTVDMKEYINTKLLREEFEKDFDLGEGEKIVRVYLPWAVQPVLEEISVEDGAFVEPVKAEKTLLAFGDSITQGYDAMRPSNRYVAKLATFLNADETNKGIGGVCFFPPLAEAKDDLNPDYITVAYGTNDWYKKGREIFKVNSKAFYAALRKNYPQAKIFAITPIWRADRDEDREFGLFDDVEKDIRDAVEGLENIIVIRGYEFVPQDTNYFADLRLHPNDEGFDSYFRNLSAEIKKYI